MQRLGLLGAGRIGQTHARAVAGVEGATITAVFDPVQGAAEKAATLSGARIDSVDAIIGADDIDAVLICTPTDLHSDQAERAARAGKAIFCEKPIDLDLARARTCVATVEAAGVPFMLGFNRRFDPTFAGLQQRLAAGEIGKPELIQITSRDPGPPPMEYIQRSGGLFRDMMIHDLDMARFLLGEELALVSATGASLVDAEIGAAGDVDTATATLRGENGALVVITNSRRATYGYDQRVEVHGETGMLMANNPPADFVTHAGSDGYADAPLHDFFMTRYTQAYTAEIEAFVRALNGEAVDCPTGRDGIAALALADECSKMADLTV